MKVPAIVAAGNTVVVKPSELTPFTGELFMDLVDEAGFPPGVVNMLPGSREAGETLVAHPLVKKVSFTGGPETAARILHACADSVKPAVLELGGKSANIVFEDADLPAATTLGAVLSCGMMAGQSCNFNPTHAGRTRWSEGSRWACRSNRRQAVRGSRQVWRPQHRWRASSHEA